MRRLLLLALLVALGAGLRLWAIGFGLPSWLHPDEFGAVFIPLNFFSGDLNPRFFTYPTLHYYLLGAVYGGYFLLQHLFGAGLSVEEFVAYHYFWDQVELLYLARLQSALFGTGAVLWTWGLARRVYGERAAWPAAALLAVAALHVRQSHLAGVDVELAFWFAGALWAAVRLGEREDWAAYALSGALVGLAAATKYPGALAGVAVAAAHLLAGRPLLDRRLWGAGGAALGVFVLASPYVLLDWGIFVVHFSSQVEHLETGHGQDLGLGWGYHLWVSLPAGLGWGGLGLGLAGGALALRERRPGPLALLAALLVFYLFIGAGRAVFARYTLPLLPLLAALAGGTLARLRSNRYLAAALLLTCAQPLYASWRTVQLLSVPDTRVQARDWIESQVPEGAVIANFGGWAGDVRVRTFEELWWALSHFERVFGRQRTDRAIAFIATLPPGAPFYSYAIQRTNMAAAPGSLAEVERLEPEYAVLHRHPLQYSRIDSVFALGLQLLAQRVASFSPPGLRQTEHRYDPLDALYVPLGDFGELARPGPEVEIWRMKEVSLPPQGRLAVRAVFARGYVAGAGARLSQGSEEEVVALAKHAIDLDPRCAEAYFLLGFLAQRAGQTEEALALYARQLELQPASAGTYHNMAMAYQSLHQTDQAERMLWAALRALPWKRSAHQALARFYQGQGRQAEALAVYQQQVARFPDRGAAYEDWGEWLERRGQPAPAAAIYRQGLEHDPGYGPLYRRLAALYLAQGQVQQAAETSERWLQFEPSRAEAHRLLAYACRSLGQMGSAREHAREMARLAPGLDGELEGWLAGP